MRVLVTGSRSYDNRQAVFDELDRLHAVVMREEPDPMLIVVHGGCPQGPDKMAHVWCRQKISTRVQEEPHPADWKPNGVYDPLAGFKRNTDMVKLGADVCLAFLAPCVKVGCRKGVKPHDSHGTAHTVSLARTTLIEVREFRD